MTEREREAILSITKAAFSLLTDHVKKLLDENRRMEEGLLTVRQYLPPEIPQDLGEKQNFQRWIELNHLVAVDLPDIIRRAMGEGEQCD